MPVRSSSGKSGFTSRTDIFGSDLLEALTCGRPAAAPPVTGSLDVVGNS
jgi:hypothetical protein